MKDPIDFKPDVAADDVVDRAAAALRDGTVPLGPSPLLVERTRQALAARRGSDAASPFRRLRWAAVAAVLLAAGGTTAWVASHRAGGSGQLATGQPAVAPVSAPPELVGFVRVDGTPKSMLPSRPFVRIDGPNCGHHHAPATDESIALAAGGGLANVVVSVSAGLPIATSYARPATPAVIDQKDCRYFPRVVTMQVGQDLVAKNSDPYLHSVHTNPMANVPVNIAQATIDPVGTRLKKIKSPETFKVTCDLHPWMVAWVAAFDHPYFAVTGADGAFRMPALPPGTYTLRAWHERLGAVEQKVTVAAGGEMPPVKFDFGQERLAAALAERAPVADAGGEAVAPCCRAKGAGIPSGIAALR